MTTPTGTVHYDMTFDQYRAMPGLNWSILKHATARAQLFAATEPSGDHDPLYSALHCALLEPDRFSSAYQLADGRRTAARKAEAEAAGVTLLTDRDFAAIEAIGAAVREHGPAFDVLTDPSARTEVSITWRETVAGKSWPMKGRIDLLVEREGRLLVVDLKAVPRVSPRHVAVEIARRCYHGQLAHYCAGLRAAHPGVEVGAAIIAYEARPPYDVGLFLLGQDEALWAGEVYRAEALARYTTAHAARDWPGACPLPVEVKLPRWAPGLNADDAGADYEEEV